MMDKLGQYANILNITQSLTFKTFKTQNISSAEHQYQVERTGLAVFK